MNFKDEFFIAGRLNKFMRASKNNVMKSVAVISVGVSVMVMIISLSVIKGFKSDIASKIFAVSGDYQIVEVSNSSLLNGKYLNIDSSYTEKLSEKIYIKNISVFAIKPTIIKTNESIKGVVFKGISSDFDFNDIKNYLVQGDLPNVVDTIRKKEILISKKLSDELKITIGDPIELLFIENSLRRDLFRVSGIFNTYLDDIDGAIVFGDIRDIQRINGWDSAKATGFDIFIKPGYDSDFVKTDIYNTIYEENTEYAKEILVDTRERYDSIFSWLEFMDINEIVVNTIMIVVCSFNILAMILIILMQKTSMIGVFKSLGMTNFSIQRIFILNGSFILLKGLFWGTLFGLLLCFIQKQFGVLKLDESSYMLRTVPIYLDWVAIIAINIFTFIVMILVQYLSTMIIIKTPAYISLKYDKR